MHELGVLYEVVRKVEKIAEEQQLTKIDTLVLQIGELSTMIPGYIEACYPAAVDGTLLQQTTLKIEILPGNARCRACGKVFNLLANGQICPGCGREEWEILCGREFLIKELLVP